MNPDFPLKLTGLTVILSGKHVEILIPAFFLPFTPFFHPVFHLP